MTKYSVNLIINKSLDSPVLIKLKIILPVITLIFTVVFIVTYLITLGFISNNLSNFNSLKRETDQLEKEVEAKRDIEAVYTVTTGRLGILEKLSANIIDFNKLLTEVNNINSNGITVKTINSDSSGNINLSLVATSSAALDSLVDYLRSKEEQKLFKEIQAQGIVREKKGNYHLNISFSSSPTLLK